MPRIFGTLRPLADTDTYPVVDVDINARGFTRVVADTAARDGIPAFLRSTSMLVFQRDTGQIWAWTGAAWSLFAFNGTGFTFDAAAIVSGIVATARLGSGSAGSNTFLRGDQTWSALGVSNLPTLTSAQLAGLLTDETGSGAAVFATAPSIAGGTHTALTGLGVRSTGAAFDVRLASAEAITADRTLTFVLGNTDRTLTIGASASVAGSNTGDQTIALTGDVTGSGTGSFAATIANNAVTLAKMATMTTASLLGRNTGGTGNVEVLSSSTVKTLLSLDSVENTALSTWPGSTNVTTLGTITTGVWNATAIGLASGGTNADLSATGGAGRFLKQTSVGGAVSVAAITASDLATGTANSTTYLRGDLTWAAVTSGFTNPMTSVGDLILGGASGAATRLAIGSSSTVLRSNGTTAAWATLGHGELSGLTTGDPHTQYLSLAPSSDSRNVVAMGLGVHVNGLVIQQSDATTFPGSGTDEPYFGVWKYGGTNPAWMLTNNDGVFQQVRQTVPLRIYNAAYTNFVSIEVGTLASDVTFRLPTTNGTNGHVLTTNGSGDTSWQAPSGGLTNPMTSVGDLIIGGASGAATRLAAGTNTHVLTLVGGSPAWQAPSGGFANPMTTNGDLITQAAGVAARLGIGAVGTFLRSNGSAAAWQALSIRSTGAAFDLTLASSEAISAGRTLSFNVNNADRTLTLSGNATISGTNTGDQTSVTGNAGTATALQTARNINGVSFNGTADITVTAAAGTLTGSTLAAGVTGSSLTSLGTIGTGVWQGTTIGLAYGGTNANLSATGGAGQVLKQTTLGGAITVANLVTADLPAIDADLITIGQVSVANGGTGTDLSATGGAGRVLKQSVVGDPVTVALLVASDIPSLDASKITTGSLAIAQGGTGAATANAGFAALSPMTTNGDLISRAGGVPSRLAVGIEGQSLRVVSGAPAWASSAGQRTNSQIASNQNDYAIDSSDVTGLVLLSADANGRTITGITGGVGARVVRLLNNGTTDIIVTHQDTASTAANRFILPFELDMVLRPGDCWTLIYDSTNSRWRLLSGFEGYINDPAFITDQFDDFSHGTNSNGTFGTQGWSLNTNGGTYTHSTNESGRYGVVQISSGTTSSGRGEIVSNNPVNAYILGNQVFEAIARVPTLAAAGVTDYSVIVGWSNNMAAAGGSGDMHQIAFVYNRSLSTNWAAVTAGASQTRTNTGVAAATTWTRLKCVLNAALNNAKFYINDVLVATHTTNFPSSGPYAFKMGIWNSADASHTSMPLQVDAWRLRILRTTRR